MRWRRSWSASPEPEPPPVDCLAMATTEQVQLTNKGEGRAGEVLPPQALAFVAGLQRRFGPRREELLRLREGRQLRLDAGGMPQFLVTPRSVPDSEWSVAK